jgi:hypothetical protein
MRRSELTAIVGAGSDKREKAPVHTSANLAKKRFIPNRFSSFIVRYSALQRGTWGDNKKPEKTPETQVAGAF